MLIRAIDFETTGLPTEEDPHAICEIGFTELVDNAVGQTVAMLVNPGRAMPCEAQAVHHISDADLAGARPITDGLQMLMRGPPDFFAAHNADYEQSFFAGGDVPWIDTWKVSLRLWPDAPSHSQQVLRYHLDLGCDREGTYSVVVIDPPWRFSGGTKGRPQHYPRMTLAEIKALPVRALLRPEGGRVILWITAPLAHRIPEIAAAWRLRYSSMIPWIKLWNGEDGMFVYANSVARGTGFEVMGNAEYAVILKAGKPASIKGRPFSGVWIEPRRQHSRKPPNLHAEIEARIPGPYVEIFSREARPGWDAWGNEIGKFGEAA